MAGAEALLQMQADGAVAWWVHLFGSAVTLFPLLFAVVNQGPFNGGGGDVPPDAGAGTSARSRTRASLHAVHQLPLEEFISEAALRKLSVYELLELLASGRWPDDAGQRRRDSLSGRRVVREKEELVAEALRRRGIGTSTGERCGICLEDYVDGCVLRVMPCGHRFDVECLDGWLLKTSDACPYCAVRIPRN